MNYYPIFFLLRFQDFNNLLRISILFNGPGIALQHIPDKNGLGVNHLKPSIIQIFLAKAYKQRAKLSLACLDSQSYSLF